MVYRSFLLFLCNPSLQFLLILHITKTAAFSEFTNDLFVKKSMFSLHNTFLSITYTLKLLFPWTFIAVSILIFFLYPHIFILCLLHWLFFFLHFSVDIVYNGPSLFSEKFYSFSWLLLHLCWLQLKLDLQATSSFIFLTENDCMAINHYHRFFNFKI